MRFLQLVLCNHWDFEDKSVTVAWTPSNELDFLWLSDVQQLQDVSLDVPHPDLLFCCDASDHGWDVKLLKDFVSDRWSIKECELSINLRELQVIRLGLFPLSPLLAGADSGCVL